MREFNLNERNFGLGIEWRNANYRKMVGFYDNSNHNFSKYALLAWTPINTPRIHAGPFGGIVTGYSHPYLPAAGLLVVANVTKQINLKLTFVPTIESIKCYGFVSAQISFKIKDHKSR